MLIKIQRWLMQPHVWRFVGLGSTVVGLFCYAISSSFNNLFGEWNLFKIFLYSSLSLIICFAVLLARAWQHSNSLRFKAHMAFLALTITSGYSFFFDRAVNKKTDAYGLASCVAFAVMSFSLSRQTHCGFELDMLYFFLGALIVQLMKIRLWLGIVGVGFSYFLIILRSYLDSPLENLYVELQDQHDVVIHVDSLQQSNTVNFVPSPLQHANHAGILQNSLRIYTRCELQHANWRLLEVLWTRLNKYLRDKDEQIPVSLVNDHNLFTDALSSQAVDNLHEKVKLMMASGFEKECLDQYNGWRREFLEMCFTMLGLKDNAGEKEKIRRWMKGSNVVLRIVLPNEHRLCDQIFSGFSSFADLSFMKLYSEVTTTLIHDFANGFAVDDERHSLNLSPDILNVFGTLHDLIPEFETDCSAQCSSSVLLSAEAISIKKTLEAIVPNGTFQVPVQVMNHLNGVLEVEDTLELVKNINL